MGDLLPQPSGTLPQAPSLREGDSCIRVAFVGGLSSYPRCRTSCQLVHTSPRRPAFPHPRAKTCDAPPRCAARGKRPRVTAHRNRRPNVTAQGGGPSTNGGTNTRIGPRMDGWAAGPPAIRVFVHSWYLLSLPSRRLPVECDFSPDGLFEARFRVENTSNLREGE